MSADAALSPHGDEFPHGRKASQAALLATLSVAAIVLAFNAWVVAPANFFYADDWGWLGRAEFQPYNWLADLWPGYIYNSRPIGEALITGMYHAVGLYPEAFHRVWLAIHVLNCLLLLQLLRAHVSLLRATLAAVTAGCWHATLMPVAWVGAVFDLLATTWCLAAVLLHRESVREGWRGAAAAVAAALAYALALRTKEFAIAMIAPLVLYDLFFMGRASLAARAKRLAPALLVFVVFALRYAWLYRQMPQLPSTDPYNSTLAIGSIADTFYFYLRQLAYAPEQSEWPAWAFLVLLLVGVLKANRILLLCLLGFVALLSPLLLLPAQRGALYLYAPHFFMAGALVAPWVRSKLATVAIALAMATLLFWPVHASILDMERAFLLGKGSYSRQLFEDYKALPRVDAEFLRIEEPYFSPFQYGALAAAQRDEPHVGQATAINILRHDPAVRVFVETELDELLPAYCAERSPGARLLDEQGGRLVDRSDWADEACAEAESGAAITVR